LKKFDFISGVLLVGMAAVILLLFREWDEFQTEQLQLANEAAALRLEEAGEIPSVTAAQSLSVPAADEIPSAIIANVDAPIPQSAPSSSNLIQFANDVLELQIDPVGGDIVGARLLEHMDTLDGEPIALLANNVNHVYVAQSGLVGINGTDTSAGRPTFIASSSNLTLAEGRDQVVLDLLYQQGDVQITKRLTLNRGDYLIGVEYLINNRSTENWSAAFYAQIKRDDYTPPSTGGMGMKPFVGAAITTPDNRYRKFDFGDLRDESFSETVDTGWAALLQNYFLGAWIPDSDYAMEYNLRQSASNGLYYIGFTQTPIQVAPGTQQSLSAGFYAGPKDQYRLRDISEHLDLTVDYGWVWWAAQPIYAVLYFLHEGQFKSFGLDSQVFGGIANWGICIILLTLFVKLLFFKLSEASYKSMARMRKIQPKLAALKERYGDDKQQFSQEMMRMYQKEKINPLGGCLPILVQMPVFIALYWVLRESVELRHEPFFGWIVDLSAKDPWFILPVVMGVSMWFQMRLNPAPPDPTQAKVMQMMPFMFTFMFMWFPAGLVLYWVSNNILSIAQQWYITRSIEKADPKES
jgi:YidC/Oxa1 family membrane protein insertase